MDKNKLRFISAMIIYGTVGTVRRFVPLSSSAVSFLRAVIGAVFLAFVLRLRKRKADKTAENRAFGARPVAEAPLSRRKALVYVLSGALIGINWITFFEACIKTSVAKATLCYYMEPVILIVLSYFLFHESFTLKKALCVVCAVLGAVLVSGIFSSRGSGSNDTAGILLGLISAVLYAAVVTINRLAEKTDPVRSTFIQLVSAAATVSPYLLMTGGFTLTNSSAPAAGTGFILLMILILGLVHTGIAYVFYYSAIPHMKMQTIAIFSYIDPVTAVLLSWLLLGEALTLSVAAGAVLIIGSAICSELDAAGEA